MPNIKTLKDRISSYESITDHKLLTAIPKVIVVNGRNSRKTTSVLHKPFDEVFLELMCGSMIKLMYDIQGSVFAYCHSDEIVIATTNAVFDDQWYNGNIQKIVSAASSIATYEFNKLATNKKVELFGDVIFTAQVFNVPNIIEVMNTFVLKQQTAIHNALYFACFYALIKKYNPDTVRQTLLDKTVAEKTDILMEEVGIDFRSYPPPFRNGVGAYRDKVIITTDGLDKTHLKLKIDMELPVFSKEQEFLGNILKQSMR